jgi:hypothetical protein
MAVVDQTFLKYSSFSLDLLGLKYIVCISENKIRPTYDHYIENSFLHHLCAECALHFAPKSCTYIYQISQAKLIWQKM